MDWRLCSQNNIDNTKYCFFSVWDYRSTVLAAVCDRCNLSGLTMWRLWLLNAWWVWGWHCHRLFTSASLEYLSSFCALAIIDHLNLRWNNCVRWSVALSMQGVMMCQISMLISAVMKENFIIKVYSLLLIIILLFLHTFRYLVERKVQETIFAFQWKNGSESTRKPIFASRVICAESIQYMTVVWSAMDTWRHKNTTPDKHIAGTSEQAYMSQGQTASLPMHTEAFSRYSFYRPGGGSGLYLLHCITW